MKGNWKRLRLGSATLLLVVASGCSGINGSYSVSPASFFLPGLVRNDAQPLPDAPTVPPAPAPAPVPVAPALVAQAQ